MLEHYSKTKHLHSDFQEKESVLLKFREPVFEERRNHIRLACVQQNRTLPSQALLPTLKVAKNHNIMYCSIPKTGSTFWKKTLKIIENEATFSSLYEFRNSKTQMDKSLKKSGTVKAEMNESAFSSFLDEAISFMFVREPYGRIFSAYNNKIHNPNTMYWRIVGRKVVQSIRDQPSVESLTYGHDVTFSEMIRFLVYAFEEGKGIDRHFLPMSERCDPCQMNYDYLGKMESFSDDAHFIIAKLKQKYNDVYISFGDSDTEAALDSAQSHVRFLYGALRATEGINYPQYNFFLRTWRDLQIRGYLSKHIDMPMSRNQASNISSEEFFSLIKEALQQPMNKTEVKQQRNEAMIQAYRSVSLTDMERLRKYVELDCLLFGYDTRPSMLFERGNTADDVFNYFDGI